VDAERGRQLVPLARERYQRVSGRRPDALSSSVEEDDRSERLHAVCEEQTEAGRGRDAVAESRDLFVPARPVGKEAAEDADDRSCALLHAVHDPELERREPEGVYEVERQDRHHHLRRDVGEEAD
jgi:hypothetical protein